jgi:hypothetical protein
MANEEHLTRLKEGVAASKVVEAKPLNRSRMRCER